MIFTASIFVCLLGVPHSYMTCEIMEGKIKFPTEQRCMVSIKERVDFLYKHTTLMDRYEIIDLICNKYGTKDQTL